ncbi:MAG: glycosyltransferase family 9 protein [Fimbriimonadaceae bacterium]|nr:glycosyltransferase family 9 protein [Fimbriimonadaceae bacterium]
MRRYEGSGFGESPRIAILSNDALGNYLAVTPLLQAVRRAFPASELVYFSGPRTEELAAHDASITRFERFLGVAPFSWARPDRGFDWVINVEHSAWASAVAAMLSSPDGCVTGPCLDAEGRGAMPFESNARGDLWRDTGWITEDLTERYPFLASGFISEIFCRLAYLEGELPAYRTASAEYPQERLGELPDTLIAMSASLPEKLWPLEKWREALREWNRAGHTVGLLGAKPAAQGRYWQGQAAEDAVVAEGLARDLRGQLTLPEVAGALGAARHVLSLDNGIMHLAVAQGTPVTALFRRGIHRLWTPPFGSVRVLLPEADEPVASIPAVRVIEAMANGD